MSCLKLYWPQTLLLYRPTDLDGQGDSDANDDPVILAFPRIAARLSGQTALLERARLIHRNRCCPECGRAAVVPVEAQAALMSRDRMPVPGSQALLGFACEVCGHEWPA